MPKCSTTARVTDQSVRSSHRLSRPSSLSKPPKLKVPRKGYWSPNRQNPSRSSKIQGISLLDFDKGR